MKWTRELLSPLCSSDFWGSHRRKEESSWERWWGVVTWPKAWDLQMESLVYGQKHSSRDWHQLVIGEVRELFIAVSIPAAHFGGVTWNSRLYKNYKVWQDFEALNRQRNLSSRQGCPGHLKVLSAAPCIIINLVTLVLQWPNINQTKRCHDGSTDGACVDNPFHGRWLHAHDKISKHSGNTCGTLLSHSANLQSLGVTASLWAPPVNSSALRITQKPSKIIPKSK